MNKKKVSSNPLVTVIVPVYQVVGFIEACALSLFEQDFLALEYIFIDDACSDGSIAILEQVIQRYPGRKPNVKIIRNPKNVGPFESRKIGTLHAGGEYVQYIDADDRVEKDMISTMYQTAKSENAEVVSCDVVVKMKSGSKFVNLKHPKSSEKVLTALLLGHINMAVWNKLIKREVCIDLYKSLNISRSVYMAEDWLISVPMYNLQLKTAHVPKRLYHYNKTNPCSLSTQTTPEFYADNSFVMEFLYDFMGSCLDSHQFELLRERLAMGVFSFSFSKVQDPNRELLRKLSFNLRKLWRSRCANFYHKSVYTFYFLRMSWVPKMIQRLRLTIKG